jgi:uncharacterized DUF497 family protein
MGVFRYPFLPRLGGRRGKTIRLSSKFLYRHKMAELIVEWDENKNAINRRIHHISFETARLVFADPDRIERLDNSLSNSSGEVRWQTLGLVGKVLFVVYTERGKNIRLISARLANKKERSSYYGVGNEKSSNWAKAY